MSYVIQRFMCEICLNPALITQKFSHDATYIHNICHTCIASHIQAKIAENIATIICPGLDCRKTLNPLECRPMIPSTLFVKWCDCLCRSAISTSKSSYCTNPYCSELILDECSGITKKCTCPRCKRLFCFNCRVPWHSGFWCSESSRQRDANDAQFGLLVEHMGWTRCPYCGQSVERTHGCRFVNCRCGRLFCHDCGSHPHIGRCGTRIGFMDMILNFFLSIIAIAIALLVLYVMFVGDKVQRK